ncbi:MAG TPA: DUF2934 domain-containing protein [Gallionella sp.]|nr:DUF2934 domain-containing protein [Gallionella sp.]
MNVLTRRLPGHIMARSEYSLVSLTFQGGIMVEQKAKAAVVKKTAAVTKSKSAAKEAPVAKKVAAKKVDSVEKKIATSAVKKDAAAKKTAAPAVEKKAPAKKSAASKAKPSPEERYRMVEMAAYFIAERHGFQGNSTEHWAAAEREIAEMLGS